MGWVSRMLLAGLAAFTVSAFAGRAEAQSPPNFYEYSLRDRVFGPGGALFPDYVNPSMQGHGWLTTQGQGNIVFAAGTADMNCQQTQVPTITVLSAPQGTKVSTQYGAFVATAIDGGSTYCLGRQVKGVVVKVKGKPRSGTLALRVTYPTLGAWYDHVVPVTR